MAKFRKRPVVIEVEAVQWAGKEDTNRIVNWLAHYAANLKGWLFFDGYIEIPTMEGKMHAMPGDWIIRGAKGEYCSCKDDVFKATYDLATP